MVEMSKNQKTIEAYNRNAQFYANKFDSYGVRTGDIDRALKLNKSTLNKVLELGCGNGRDAQYIISRVGADNYIGIDASKGLIDLAKKKVPEGEFQTKDMRYIDVSFQKNWQAPDTSGIIISFASVLHLKHGELEEMINKCHKWLKIGGILYISTKYGGYRELEIENLGDKKYYYPYKPEDIIGMAGGAFETVYNIIQDSDYGPELVIGLRKI
jgi:SAM-dependent methyltransferase